MAKVKKMIMYFLDDVEKVFEIDGLPYDWFPAPSQQVKVEGKSGLWISRKDMLKVFEAAYLDNELIDIIRRTVVESNP